MNTDALAQHLQAIHTIYVFLLIFCILLYGFGGSQSPLNAQPIKTMNNCPVTGLSIIEKKHWSFTHPGENYITKISRIGADIIYVDHIADRDVIPTHVGAINLPDLLREEQLSGQPIIIVVNCRNIANVRLTWKKEFTNCIYTTGSNVNLMVLFRLTPELRFQAEMFQSIAPATMQVVLADTYNDAMNTVMNFKSGNLPEPSAEERSSEQANLQKKEFLADIARMAWLEMFDQRIVLPPTDSSVYSYFKAIDSLQHDLEERETEQKKNTERAMQDFQNTMTRKIIALNAELEEHKRHTEQFAYEKPELSTGMSAHEMDMTRVATAIAEKTAVMKELLGQINSLEIDPDRKQRLTSLCSNLIETSTKERQLRTELTATDSIFLSTLQKHHPNLSQRELKIGLLIKLDYNSRDIARTIGISSRGIESIRYRMHKKLGLDKHRSLKTYLTDLMINNQ